MGPTKQYKVSGLGTMRTMGLNPRRARIVITVELRETMRKSLLGFSVPLSKIRGHTFIVKSGLKQQVSTTIASFTMCFNLRRIQLLLDNGTVVTSRWLSVCKIASVSV